ncbi:MAG: glutamate-1-semialdehyde 2,1-aminomutase [Saprospiraceae bacterium]|nr:glutamate-1-semialdehyde 2,1-aminomutase [Saprospiraceae bacterium]
MIERKRSAALFDEAKTLFPGGVNSPVRAFRSVHGPPLFIKRGEGPYIIDEDDRRYIDFCASWGPLILGHDHPHIREAIIQTVRKGTSFGTPTRLGNEIGALIQSHHPHVEQLRFVSSGTEAVMSAVRLARGYTGRSKILKFEGCYHGHVDSLLVKAGSGLATFGVSTSAGIPTSFARETLVAPLADLAEVSRIFAEHGTDIAAVIIEPIPANNGLLLQHRSYLQALRAITKEHGTLLIFDEVITGFRTAFAGATALYGVVPDLFTFGKVIGGGMPVGAFAGSREIMKSVSPEGPVYQAGTLSANPVAMAAGKAALEQLLAPNFYPDLNRKAARFCEKIASHASHAGLPMHIQRVGSIFWLAFGSSRIARADQIDGENMKYFKALHGLLLDKGVYLGPSGYEVGFISGAHEESVLEEAASIICAALDQVFA